MNGKTWLVIAIIIIAVGIVVGLYLSKDNKPIQTNNVSENEAVNIISTIDDKKENFVNTKDNVIDEQNKQVEEPTVTETFTETPKTEQEKAILIVKKDYGESPNIEFSVIGMEGNRHIVSVTYSTETESKVLAFYKVDVSNETFDKEYD